MKRTRNVAILLALSLVLPLAGCALDGNPTAGERVPPPEHRPGGAAGGPADGGQGGAGVSPG
jgi:hypothetical protein